MWKMQIVTWKGRAELYSVFCPTNPRLPGRVCTFIRDEPRLVSDLTMLARCRVTAGFEFEETIVGCAVIANIHIRVSVTFTVGESSPVLVLLPVLGRVAAVEELVSVHVVTPFGAIFSLEPDKVRPTRNGEAEELAVLEDQAEEGPALIKDPRGRHIVTRDGVAPPVEGPYAPLYRGMLEQDGWGAWQPC